MKIRRLLEDANSAVSSIEDDTGTHVCNLLEGASADRLAPGNYVFDHTGIKRASEGLPCATWHAWKPSGSDRYVVPSKGAVDDREPDEAFDTLKAIVTDGDVFVVEG